LQIDTVKEIEKDRIRSQMRRAPVTVTDLQAMKLQNTVFNRAIGPYSGSVHYF